MNNYLYYDNILQSLLFTSLIFILFIWYHGILSFFTLTLPFSWLSVLPLPWFFLSILLITYIYYSFQTFYKWFSKNLYFSLYDSYLYGELLFKFFKTNWKCILIQDAQKNSLVKTFKQKIANEIIIYFYNDYKRPIFLINYIFTWFTSLFRTISFDTIQFITEYPNIFFRKALFCNTVTFWLLVFYYRVFMGLDTTFKNINKFNYKTTFNGIKLKFKLIYNNHIVTIKTRLALWNILNYEFYTFFFFLIRFFKINDLIWQDGFLIDFLQKKVIDRWVRGFVIFSANLFSERFLFDRVVRFFIDFILKPVTHRFIYEVNSPAQLLVININLLFLFFLTFFLIFLIV